MCKMNERHVILARFKLDGYNHYGVRISSLIFIIGTYYVDESLVIALKEETEARHPTILPESSTGPYRPD